MTGDCEFFFCVLLASFFIAWLVPHHSIHSYPPRPSESQNESQQLQHSGHDQEEEERERRDTRRANERARASHNQSAVDAVGEASEKVVSVKRREYDNSIKSGKKGP